MEDIFLKVGDVVQIRENLDILEDYCMFHNEDINDCVTANMKRYGGEITKIVEVTSWGKYRLKIDDGEHNWTDEMLDAKIWK